MRYRKRLEKLERALLTEPAILYFADGGSATLNGRGDYLLRLLGCAFSGECALPEQAQQLELIRQSVDAREPGGGHIIELARSIMLSPGEAGEEPGPQADAIPPADRAC